MKNRVDFQKQFKSNETMKIPDGLCLSMTSYKTFLGVFIILLSLSFHECRTKLQNSTELTNLLQNIMKTYDRRILPTKDGKPTVVKLQMYIGDMVPVEAIHMHYSMDLYLREFWYDYRLTLPLNGSEQFPLNGDFISDIWTPDIYFPAGKKGKLHDITKLNSLIRILPNGEVRSSQRVSVTAFCPMNLENFPFDEQRCEFVLEPYSYNNKQCKLEWNYAGGGPIFQPEDLMMFEFTMHGRDISHRTIDYGLFGFYDRLVVKFHFRRNVNYYLLQNYFPTSLVVVLSWVGFWIDYRSTPARVALGITTVLTITTLANSIRATLPPVSYSKSIDYYLLACFLFVFAALVEYATVGITDIKWRKNIKFRKRKRSAEHTTKNQKDSIADKVKSIDQRKSEDRGINGNVSSKIFLSTLSLRRGANSKLPRSEDNEGFESDFERVEEEKSDNDDHVTPDHNDNTENTTTSKERKSFGFSAIVNARNLAKKLAERHRKRHEIHIIDKLSRYLFPIIFIIFNILYFSIVLTRSNRYH